MLPLGPFSKWLSTVTGNELDSAMIVLRFEQGIKSSEL